MEAGKQSIFKVKSLRLTCQQEITIDVTSLTKSQPAIQVLLSPLPESQKSLALAFLAKITEEELTLFKSRLSALSVEGYCKLVQEFEAKDSGGLSDGRLLRYLKFIILPGWTSPSRHVQWSEVAAANEETVAEEVAVTEGFEEESAPESKQLIAHQLARLPAEIYDMILQKIL